MIEAILEPPLSSSITIELTETIHKEVNRRVKPETEQEAVCTHACAGGTGNPLGL